ncbi:MAG: hypothetical protein AMS26_09375 [Bacteroides sp. SM23_62]|nr:MAG: hypothetical protein AMS26_09375 [Bacteroides sp. SM23_62]
MPWAQLIDIGYRIDLTDKEEEEVLVVGENIRSINIDFESGGQDTVMFRKAAEYVFDNLIPFQLKFPDIDRMEIIKKYLLRRDSEEIINDGFYIGCGDVCALIGAILMKYGYDCKLIHAVSSKFSNTNDLGHVFLLIGKDDNQYLYDPSMSDDIIKNYTPGSAKQFKIRSEIGDLFVFASHRNPRTLGIIDIYSLNKMRMMAFNYWQGLK